MNEQERADFYQAHKDDPEVWGDAEQRDSPIKKRLSATITVRLSSDEAEALSQRAQAGGRSYGEVVRDALKDYLFPKNVLTGHTFTVDYNQPNKTGYVVPITWETSP